MLATSILRLVAITTPWLVGLVAAAVGELAIHVDRYQLAVVLTPAQ